MARTIPSVEPAELTAGDSWQWDRVLSDYPPTAGWALTYAISGPHPTIITVTAATSALGDYFEVRVPAATTATYTDGQYKVAGYATKGTDRFTVYEGQLRVRPDFATETPALSHAARTLAIIDSALEGRLTSDLEEYQINGRAVKKIPAMELVKLQGIYRWRVWQEMNPGRNGPGMEVRFGVPA